MTSPKPSYGTNLPAVTGGGVVEDVRADGPAARAGVSVGDTVVAVGGVTLRDVIDWQWLSDGDEVTLTVRPASGQVREVRVTRRPDESWGLAFTEAVFDGVRTCRNRCAFCFMAQLPEGMRPALYLRDDDYRLSFLQGNFITLTNLRDTDIRRISAQHLSPLYVSLHAVDPEVRRQLVCARSDRALQRFDELLAEGVDLHVQIVLVPGVNDKEVLDETLSWLAAREGVLSVGVVPLGFTSRQESFTKSYGGAVDAGFVIAQVQPWQEAFRLRDEITWVYLADEFYLNAGADVPPAEHYDGYPQFENGIGLVRSFTDDFEALAEQFAAAVELARRRGRTTFVTGELFAPTLERLVAGVDPRASVRVLAVRNHFFGGNVSVAGLLTGADIAAALGAEEDQAVYLLPAAIANRDGLLLDDVPCAELGIRSGREVRLISCDARGLLDALRDLAAGSPRT